MWVRRLLTAFVISGIAAAPAAAQDWRSKYPEIVFSVVPAENSGGVTNRYEPFMEYLSETLGVKFTLRIANDYAAVIEGIHSGQVHVAHFGPSAYARAFQVTQGDVEPFATAKNSAGAVGYHSVLYVRSGDRAQTVQDLKGRNLCLVDPNSTSGNNVPRFAMDKLGIDPETFFGKGGLRREPRECRDRASAGHLRWRFQLVEYRSRVDVSAHGCKRHGQGG